MMAMLKCKMCGGNLEITAGASVVECEYCGTTQTIPSVDDEKKLTLFSRANRLRFGCEFDRAAGVYESIVADFPEEAEAYWGLVLCKYGIEYVDDPATGKKVPTCHRSSFDSVLEDANFDQACENADVLARKVYRDEAKAIEELRRGIIEVSGKEDPYDIFICYKETAEDGGRTIDSVLAQDVYDALTAKGYRVFFSRVTLEDKLGQEYEPYIFAALNSAKIMLAFGTDYEHFNAVWVKNEWSRYLQLMAKDKTKHLIPCYKNIDAYDMPKEFAKLQAQDMGKVGAVQDLLRGIEKLLPREEKTVPVVQQVVQSGGPNAEALVKRGNMALEDGQWERAKEFFDQALNINAESAEAYLGKALADERAKDLTALAQKYDASRSTPDTEKKQAGSRDLAEEGRIVEKYRIPYYLEAIAIRRHLVYDFSYLSRAASYAQIGDKTMQKLNANRDLTRAEKYAAPALKAKIVGCKNSVSESYAASLKAAQADDAQRAAKDMDAYRRFLVSAESKVGELHAKATTQRDADYQAAVTLFNEKNYAEARKCFLAAGLSAYQDSAAYVEKCDRALCEQAEQERVEAAKQARKDKKIITILAIIVAVVAAAVLLVTRVIIPGNEYKAAEALLAEGSYDEAAAAFAALGDYKDAAERVQQTGYSKAEALLAAGKSGDAAIAFEALGNYSDARERSLSLWGEITQRESLSTAAGGTIGLKRDGTVMMAGNAYYYDQDDVSGWTDIMAVSAGWIHAVGLKSDGTVVAVGENNGAYGTDIVAVAAGSEHIVALKNDGTVTAAGYNYYHQCDVSGWSDIVAIAAAGNLTVGLKSDGTVVTAGDNRSGQRIVYNWTDIVAVAAGGHLTVGLKSDGTVVAVGKNNYGQCDVSSWTDITAIATSGSCTVGLKSDGTVVAVGENDYGQCDVSGWTDITAISTAGSHTVGLKSDGTVVAVGRNDRGQCDVSDWTDIKVPE